MHGAPAAADGTRGPTTELRQGGHLLFTAALDARCQRGLHWRVRAGQALLGRLRDAGLHARITGDPRIVHAREHWGSHALDRYVLPFRFELRIWTRPGELSFIHRATARPPQREADRAAFFALLSSWGSELLAAPVAA